MKLLCLAALLRVALFLGCAAMVRAEHRATHLGNPATRFADPLVAPDDLRWRFRDPALRKDIADVLRQWGWKGKIGRAHV